MENKDVKESEVAVSLNSKEQTFDQASDIFPNKSNGDTENVEIFGV